MKRTKMATQDKCCTIAPYFRVHDGELDSFRELCVKLVEKTDDEAKCLYFGFSFDGNQVHCREGYEDANGLLAHANSVAPLFEEALKIAEITRLEVHGPKEELAKLREPLSKLNPRFFTLEYGFRR